MGWKIHALIALLVAVSSQAERRRYDGWQQWEVTPTTRDQLDLLRSIDQDQVLFFDGPPGRVNMRVEMLVAPSVVREMYQTLSKSMKVKVMNTNIQSYVDAEFARLDAKHKPGFLVYDPDDYNTLEDIDSELGRLAVEACPSTHTCSMASIGSSYEGRDINQLSITSSSSHHSVWIDSLIHAREWLAGTTVMRMADYLMTSYGSDDDATHLLDNYDFYFVPVMNPDGYEYSWTNDRFWRKSRNENDGTSCVGTDLNRNYPVYWDAGGGSSGNPCSDTYHGENPGDAPETQAVMNSGSDIQDDSGRLLVWISIHTNAEFYLLPYGGTSSFDCNYPSVYDEQLQAADQSVAAMEAVGGLNWFAGNACEYFYPADGITMDWTYDPTDGANVKYSYTPELRGPGFDPPASFIEISFEENWAALVALIREIDIIEGF